MNVFWSAVIAILIGLVIKLVLKHVFKVREDASSGAGALAAILLFLHFIGVF